MKALGGYKKTLTWVIEPQADENLKEHLFLSTIIRFKVYFLNTTMFFLREMSIFFWTWKWKSVALRQCS